MEWKEILECLKNGNLKCQGVVNLRIKFLWVTLDDDEQQILDDILELIKDVVLSQPQGYFVHRDFHSRNIMFKRGKVSVIDYQDARVGAITYDLVSLLKDVYIRFDREKVVELALELGSKE